MTRYFSVQSPVGEIIYATADQAIRDVETWFPDGATGCFARLSVVEMTPEEFAELGSEDSDDEDDEDD